MMDRVIELTASMFPLNLCGIKVDDRGVTYHSKQSCKNAPKKGFFNYNEIESCQIGDGYGLVILTIRATNNRSVVIGRTKRDRPVLEEIVSHIMNRSQSAVNMDAILDEEHRMKCNVCGNIFCFSYRDIILQSRAEKRAAITNLLTGAAQVSAALGGNRLDMMNANTLANTNAVTQPKITDYSACPRCGSKDIMELTQEAIAEKSENQQHYSEADEILKFKDLLDKGIITQEEFDAKKKQIFGL